MKNKIISFAVFAFFVFAFFLTCFTYAPSNFSSIIESETIQNFINF